MNFLTFVFSPLTMLAKLRVATDCILVELNLWAKENLNPETHSLSLQPTKV